MGSPPVKRFDNDEMRRQTGGCIHYRDHMRTSRFDNDELRWRTGGCWQRDYGHHDRGYQPGELFRLIGALLHDCYGFDFSQMFLHGQPPQQRYALDRVASDVMSGAPQVAKVDRDQTLQMVDDARNQLDAVPASSLQRVIVP